MLTIQESRLIKWIRNFAVISAMSNTSVNNAAHIVLDDERFKKEVRVKGVIEHELRTVIRHTKLLNEDLTRIGKLLEVMLSPEQQLQASNRKIANRKTRRKIYNAEVV